MSPNYTKKEAEVYARFGQGMQKAHQNPNQGLGTLVENLAKEKPNHITSYREKLLDLTSLNKFFFHLRDLHSLLVFLYLLSDIPSLLLPIMND